MTVAHVESFEALRSLHFTWVQDPKVVLNEKLKIVGLESVYLETDLELFKVFHKNLHWNLERKYCPLLDLVVPAHFRWQTTVLWLLMKCRPTNGSTYDLARRTILIPSINKDE